MGLSTLDCYATRSLYYIIVVIISDAQQICQIFDNNNDPSP